ncbi:multidrug ABC transporter ATP-binding protein [Alicyclobacillus contaminans]|uniref:ATP-binding cassette domain-containing protein n=1 Tax=Alicyclobacillus contaminans TaxID=392016 RepID=UPI0003F70A4E|nr:ATP-binding cassette domain-containing protein [Alicyclobacillus contaminans]GMA51483.1 multidrug ABC transporter ATP-binding protein [Alicyclobacillus contaminans]
MDEVTVRVRDLAKRFGEVHAVQGVSFEVHAGECFGLLGPNGAGKSTTLKMLTTLLPRDGGTIEIAGVPLTGDVTRVRARIGYVPQMLSVDGSLTGYENLLIFAKLYGLRRGERERRIADILELVGLGEAADRLVKTYSGGMIRKLEIGQAILHQPRVLFLDEPTVGLDPVARKGVWEHIERLQQEQNMTILLTTHYMEEAESLCTRIAIMSRGRIAAVGTPAELRAQMGNPDASMDDVFAHFAGSFEHEEGGMKHVFRSRRTARRMG